MAIVIAQELQLYIEKNKHMVNEEISGLKIPVKRRTGRVRYLVTWKNERFLQKINKIKIQQVINVLVKTRLRMTTR